MRYDVEKNMVCSDPPIWVFDGLLSDALLARIDDSFDGVKWRPMNGRNVRTVQLNTDDNFDELTNTKCQISHIEEITPCNKVWIMDVGGRRQSAHMDGWEIEKNRESLKHLDLSKCSVQSHRGFNTIIPTLSFVIYFNDSGGCTFPRADLPNPTIPAKRGRILMFQNYKDSERPAHNPAAMHFGEYGDIPKRVMTAGVMSSETPSGLLDSQHAGGQKTRGFLYAPIMHRSNTSCGDTFSERAPSPPRAPPKPAPPKVVIQLFARRADDGGLIVEAQNVGGEDVAKIMLKVDSTMGTLRQSLAAHSQATLVCEDEVLDHPNSTKVSDTRLVEGIDLPQATDTETGAFVEWDVIDTVFVKKASDDKPKLLPEEEPSKPRPFLEDPANDAPHEINNTSSRFCTVN